MRTFKAITKKEIARFIFLSSNSSYAEELKNEYKNLGRKILKYIAQEMGLKAGEFEIRWNPGGIAVSGDHTLHATNVYLALHDNLGSGWFYYRSCKGLKDYSGRQNQIVDWDHVKNGLGPLISALKVIQAGAYKDFNGDIVMTLPLVEFHAMNLIKNAEPSFN